MPTNISFDGGTVVYISQIISVIKYSIDNNNWNTINFPCLITNTNLVGILKIYFTDMYISNENQYFICNSNNIQFGSDSLNSDKTIPNILVDFSILFDIEYNGFIDNSSGHSNISIFNLFVKNQSPNVTSNGWIAGNYFGGSNNYIINCSSNGDINNGGGGIVGSNAANDGGSLYIIGCSSSGIIDFTGGGIVGSFAGYNGLVIVVSCWSSGNISGGGIVGENSYNCQITHCFSTGNISGNYAGGILGTNNINAIITNCYSTGNIIGNYAGGIYGGKYNANFDTINITNCYTTGNINGSNAGGIIGLISGNNTGNRTINNCYVTGTTSQNKGYIIGGYNNEIQPGPSDYFIITNCYSEAYHNSSGWKYSNANTFLLGTSTSQPGVGDTWVSINNTTPYRIFNMGYTPYSYKIIDKNTTTNKYNLIREYSSFVTQGQSTTGAIINNLSYQKLKITEGTIETQNSINIIPETGVITTTSSTSPGSYTIYVSNNGYNGSLYFTIYKLTINDTSTENEPLKIPIIYMKSLFTNNSLVYYKPHSLSCGGVGTVKNYKAKCHKT